MGTVHGIAIFVFRIQLSWSSLAEIYPNWSPAGVVMVLSLIFIGQQTKLKAEAGLDSGICKLMGSMNIPSLWGVVWKVFFYIYVCVICISFGNMSPIVTKFMIDFEMFVKWKRLEIWTCCTKIFGGNVLINHQRPLQLGMQVLPIGTVLHG